MGWFPPPASVRLKGVGAKDVIDGSDFEANLLRPWWRESPYLVDIGSAGLLLHRNVEESYWRLSDLTDSLAPSVSTETVVLVDVELVVDQGSSKLGVDGHQLALVKACCKVGSKLLIEPKLVLRLVVQNRWS